MRKQNLSEVIENLDKTSFGQADIVMLNVDNLKYITLGELLKENKLQRYEVIEARYNELLVQYELFIKEIK